MRRILAMVLVLGAVGMTASPAAAQPAVEGAPAVAAPAVAAPTLGAALGSVRWQGPVPSPEMLEGKSAVVLVYAGWCPKCNVWSGDLFRQLVEAAHMSPVLLFAINADESGFDARYVQSRNFMGPNIFHGYDPTIHTRLGMSSNLFQYVIFGPDGKLRDRGYGGMYSGNEETKQFSMARRIRDDKQLGNFAIMQPEMPPVMRNVLWPFELGQPMTDKTLLRVRGQLPKEMHEQFNQAIVAFLDKQIEQCRAWSKGEVPDQIRAYEISLLLSRNFGSTPQGKMCQKYVELKDADDAFKRELAASKMYFAKVREAGGNPRSIPRLMNQVASRHQGTWYGDLAAQAAESGVLRE